MSGDEVHRDALPSGQTWLYEIRDLTSDMIEVGVNRILGQAWSEFACSKRFVRDHTYTVTANIVACKNKRMAIQLAQAHRHKLAAAGEHVLAYDRTTIDWHAAARKANRTKALRAGAAIVCMETEEVFLSTCEAARARGLSTAAVYNVVNGHVPTAGGQHWRRVAIDDLTQTQRLRWLMLVSSVKGWG